MSAWTLTGPAARTQTADASDGDFAVTFWNGHGLHDVGHADRRRACRPAPTRCRRRRRARAAPPATRACCRRRRRRARWSAPLAVHGVERVPHGRWCPNVVVGADGVVEISATFALVGRRVGRARRRAPRGGVGRRRRSTRRRWRRRSPRRPPSIARGTRMPRSRRSTRRSRSARSCSRVRRATAVRREGGDEARREGGEEAEAGEVARGQLRSGGRMPSADAAWHPPTRVSAAPPPVVSASSQRALEAATQRPAAPAPSRTSRLAFSRIALRRPSRRRLLLVAPVALVGEARRRLRDGAPAAARVEPRGRADVRHAAQHPDAPPRGVDRAVVEPAQEHAVVGVGGAAVGVGDDVVDLAPRGGHGAAGDEASAVAQRDRATLVRREAAFGGAEAG